CGARLIDPLGSTCPDTLTSEPLACTLPFRAVRVRLGTRLHRKPPPVSDALQVPSNAAGGALGSWVTGASERAGSLGGCCGFAAAEGGGSAEVGAGSCTSLRTACFGSGVSSA